MAALLIPLFLMVQLDECHDIQHNDIQHNDTQHNNK
jgi:hypothetical protein